MRRDRFALGQTVATPGAFEAFARTGEAPLPFLAQHATGTWGELGDEDKAENEFALEHGFRILCAYRLTDNTRIWIIREADRSVTTILLPEEYWKSEPKCF
jgi:hypothetical protein